MRPILSLVDSLLETIKASKCTPQEAATALDATRALVRLEPDHSLPPVPPGGTP